MIKSTPPKIEEIFNYLVQAARNQGMTMGEVERAIVYFNWLFEQEILELIMWGEGLPEW